jgi:hypothetical protein
LRIVSSRDSRRPCSSAENHAVHPDPVGELLLGQAGLVAEPDHVGGETLGQGIAGADGVGLGADRRRNCR